MVHGNSFLYFHHPSYRLNNYVSVVGVRNYHFGAESVYYFKDTKYHS